MSNLPQEGGFRMPTSLIVGIALYAFTSAFSTVWFASNLSSRVNQLEAQSQSIQNVPLKIAVLESRMGDMVDILKQIRDRFPINGNSR